MKRHQVKNQVKPSFFGIEQGVCNKKMVKNRVKLSLPLFFGLFPKNKPYSSRISLIPGEFRPILVEKYQLCGCYLTERRNRLTPASTLTTRTIRKCRLSKSCR